MGNGLNIAITVSIIVLTICTLTFSIFLIQILTIVKRILLKIELKIDTFSLTQEEIKLKILSFLDEILNKIKNYGKIKKKVLKSIKLSDSTQKGGGEGDEKGR